MDAVELAMGLRAAFAVAGAADALEGWPELRVTRNVAPASLPVCAVLGAAAEGAPAPCAALVAGLRDGASALRWGQTYGAADFGADFLQSYGWTELIGLRGPIASDFVAVGVLLLGPGVVYPPHAHEAAEVYLPLSGKAEWMRGDAPYAPVAPGQAIHHPSWLPHAMRTGAEPLVAAYVWRGGNLAAKSRIIAGG
ncbi:MAG: cupin domain-containing protein [Rhodobacteraceae bacterium]|nr:cupin domain-containing protein [Paracoccaceae bacterium]